MWYGRLEKGERDMGRELNTRFGEAEFRIPENWQSGIPLAENPYPSVLVDITSRCNMHCNFCYYQNRKQEDMPVSFFEHICKTLPFPIILKLAGGEPTLHPQFPEFIRLATVHDHKTYTCSNGLRYRDPEFMASLVPLHELHAGFSLGISMDGGTGNAKAYEMIAGRDCLKEKLEAFAALVQHRHYRICLTAIIVRGLNEDVIGQLIGLAKEHPEAVRYIHLRNAGRTGAFLDTEPYSLDELKALVRPHFSAEQFLPRCIGELFCPPESGRDCCYRFRPTPRLQISLVEFASEKSANCPKRGRILLGSDRILPLFHSIRNEL